MKTFKKKITSSSPLEFEGTTRAFLDLISKPMWYYGILINGKPITASNASQIKNKFKGKSRKGISQDYMENILLAAGYTITQPTVWQK